MPMTSVVIFWVESSRVAESTRPKMYRFVDFDGVNLLLNMAEREFSKFHCCVCVWKCSFLLVVLYNEAFSYWDYIVSVIDEWMNRCVDVGLGGMILVRENRSFLRKTCPSSASSTKNFHIDYLGIKSEPQWWDASDCQSHGRAQKMLNNDSIKLLYVTKACLRDRLFIRNYFQNCCWERRRHT
jgi:hypothetical protein